MYTIQIIEAAAKGDIDNVKFLSKNQINLNKYNESGYTPLLMACMKNNIELIKFFIEAGADVNQTMIQNKKIKNNTIIHGYIGTSPLMLVAMAGNEEMVRLLINKGADKTLKTQAMATAQDFARWTLEQRKHNLTTKELAAKDFSNFDNIINIL